MHVAPAILLIVAAGVVGLVHSVLPDHWVPLAVVARTQRWSLMRVSKISGLAAAGHVLASLVLAGAIALIGLQFQHEIDTRQGQIVGAVLAVTGVALLVWSRTHQGHGHSHPHGGHEHDPHTHSHEDDAGHLDEAGHSHAHASHSEQAEGAPARLPAKPSMAGWLATIAVPFGVAASPDLTILPIGLGSSAYGGATVVSTLGAFTVATIGTFVGLTLLATVLGYQIKAHWVEHHAGTITSLVLVGIGAVAFVGL
jgi:nickel/cobalt exporter